MTQRTLVNAAVKANRQSCKAKSTALPFTPSTKGAKE